MHVHSARAWDERFFARFSDLRNSFYEGEPWFLGESLEELRKVFHPLSPFAELLTWEALLVTEGPSLDSRPLGRLIVSANRKATSPALSCGWFECTPDTAVAQALFARAEQRAREWGCRVMKTPLQAHFFLSYRIKLPGGGAPFYGEPIYKDYYHRLFADCGFAATDTWDTTLLDTPKTYANFRSIKDAVGKRSRHSKKVRVRYIRLHDWERELRTVHDLFVRSYSCMPEYEPIPFEAFRVLYDDFRYFAHPFASYIVEYGDEPVGFCICYFDPLHVLRARAERTRQLGFLPSKVRGRLVDLESIVRQRLNTKRLLISYVGRITPSDGSEVKGIQARVSRRIWLLLRLARPEEVLVTYTARRSESRKSFNDEYRTLVSQYVLYGKEVASS